MFLTERSHAATVPALIAFAAAALAACFLQLAAGPIAALDGWAEALWITGWVMAVWAVFAGAGACTLLRRRRGLSSRSAQSSVALLVATVGLLALIALLYPPIGAGSGAG
jgi:hypothetical protein